MMGQLRMNVQHESNHLNSCRLSLMGVKDMGRKVCVFPQMLEKLMVGKKISQADLSRKLNIPATTVSQWCAKDKSHAERSTVKDSGHTLALLEFFSCTYEYLFFGEGLNEKELNKMIEEVIAEKAKLEAQLAMSELEKKHLQQKLDAIQKGQLTFFDNEVNSEILAKN